MNAFSRTWIRPFSSVNFALFLAACGSALIAVAAPPSKAMADTNSFTLKQPLNNATVRETVPIRVPRNELDQSAYATVTIDGAFRAAPAAPEEGDKIFSWDTKNPFTTPDKPDQEQTTPDGSHTVVVDLYDHDSNLIAEATSTVKVANKISSLPDGVHLMYKWRPNETISYNRHVDVVQTDGGQKTKIQSADVKLDRSVEDISNGEILLRDDVNGSGQITFGAAANPEDLAQVYKLSSKYWTVDKFGALLTDNKPIGNGNHFGFCVPELPSQRVNTGDSWQTHLWAAIEWASDEPTFLRGTAHLDGFEWQDGYPTAKITETYDGMGRFNLIASSNVPPVEAGNVHIVRTVWFALRGRICRAHRFKCRHFVEYELHSVRRAWQWG